MNLTNPKDAKIQRENHLPKFNFSGAKSEGRSILKKKCGRMPKTSKSHHQGKETPKVYDMLMQLW